MEVNVTQETIDAVQEMVHESFLVNAKLDRMQSILNTKLAYNNLGDFVHKKFAHIYAMKFGDGIAETIEGYNIPIEYGNIPKQNLDYQSVKQAIIELKDLTIDFQNKLNMCAKIAFDNMDVHVFVDILDLIREHNNYVRQSILLLDKINIYGNNPSFDAHLLEHFNILD